MNDRRAWMEGHLQWAATHFGVQPHGQTVHGHRQRSVGTAVHDTDGQDAWLRVVYEDPGWGEGDYLGHNLTANTIQGVSKPQVKRWHEWDDQGRTLRGEISTLIVDRPVSDDMILHAEPDLPDRWLSSLRAALATLSAHPMPANGVDPDYVNHGITAFFGITIDIRSATWTTAHTDLHWANVTAPNLYILDWETWGKAPAGYDAATLYCTGLLAPDTATQIHATFADTLDTPSGRIATLAATVRFLRFADDGQHLELARPLRALAAAAIDRL